MKILVLCTEAHGGFGGVAVYNQDLIDGLCLLPFVDQVRVVPRIIREAPENVPDKAAIVTAAALGVRQYVNTLIAESFGDFDILLCTHLHLLPFAKICASIRRKPLLCVMYGVEAWQPSGRMFVDRIAAGCDRLISISPYTKKRYLEWSDVSASKVSLLPNAIHLESYSVAPKSQKLLEKYGCEDNRIIMTLGRLDARERQKGFDELIDQMPALLADAPDLKYLIVGDGDDQARLKDKARKAGVADQVVFCGRVGDDEKADHYRLADVFSMVGRQEGFGFVFLEAMACGVPVVASELDGSHDAILSGKLGQLANPDKPDTIRLAILDALKKPRGIPAGLDYYSFDRFVSRLNDIIAPYQHPKAEV